MSASVEGLLRAALGADIRVLETQSATGGCIHDSQAIATDRGRFFLKLNSAAHASMFEAEADGLQALTQAGMRVPSVIACGTHEGKAYLLLEHLDLRARKAQDDEALGRALAALHGHRGERYGWQRDNFIGLTPQHNKSGDDWTAFWIERRLRPQLMLAIAGGYDSVGPPGLELIEQLPALLSGYRPAASLLHGDLWSGNAGVLKDGTPVIFDPAVFYGDAETDLAMTELFGGFSAHFYAAYAEARPIDSGYEQRKLLYNLYHVLNHLNLFGGGYLNQALQLMRQLTA